MNSETKEQQIVRVVSGFLNGKKVFLRVRSASSKKWEEVKEPIWNWAWYEYELEERVKEERRAEEQPLDGQIVELVGVRVRGYIQSATRRVDGAMGIELVVCED